jgi:hypothetical protein
MAAICNLLVACQGMMLRHEESRSFVSDGDQAAGAGSAKRRGRRKAAALPEITR